MWQKIKDWWSDKKLVDQIYEYHAYERIRFMLARDVVKYNPDLYLRMCALRSAAEMREALHQEYGMLLPEHPSPHEWSKMLNLIEKNNKSGS